MNRSFVVLISGTSRGLGRYLAQYYLSKNYTVIGCSRSEDVVYGEGYRHFSVDVSDEKAVVQMCIDIREEYGKLDVLINNAGVSTSSLLPVTSLATVRDTFSVNTFGPIILSREAVKLMVESGGRIVSLSSIHVPYSSEGTAIYGASKSALEQFSVVLAREVYRFGITVNVLVLSIVEGIGMAQILSQHQKDNLLGRTITKSVIEGCDVTNALDFLISNSSSKITGERISVGGS